MKLRNLILRLTEADTEDSKRGSYAGVKFSDQTQTHLKELLAKLKVPTPIDPAKFHTTVIYSRKYLPDYKAEGKLAVPYIGTATTADIWDWTSKTGNKNKCLVIKYDCKQLIDRHEELMKTHGATFDYAEYIPHITLSYDIQDWNQLDELNDQLKQFPPIEIVEEYQEDLNF